MSAVLYILNVLMIKWRSFDDAEISHGHEEVEDFKPLLVGEIRYERSLPCVTE